MKTDDRGGTVSGEKGRGLRRPRPDTARAKGPLGPSQLLADFVSPALALLVAGAFAVLLNVTAGPHWAR
jgi:hypothetical protein